jgi:hypothetical protein
MHACVAWVYASSSTSGLARPNPFLSDTISMLPLLAAGPVGKEPGRPLGLKTPRGTPRSKRRSHRAARRAMVLVSPPYRGT